MSDKATQEKLSAQGAAREQTKQLSTYEWTAVDKRNMEMHGEMQAKNANAVKAELRHQGMTPKAVKEKPKPLFGGNGSRVKSRDIAMFSRQISTMIASGVPMVQAFDIISAGQKNPRFKKMLVDIKQGLEGGLSMHEAMGKYPVQFDELFRNLVQAGESAGVLDTVLATVADYKERTESIKSKIKKALFYPIAVLAVAFLVMIILMVFVIPVFQKVFVSAGVSLPALTQFVVDVSKVVQHMWLGLIVGIGIFVTVAVMSYKRSEKFQHLVDRGSLRIPVIGNILRQSAIARFARTLGVTFHAGVPLVEALDSVSGATGSMEYGLAIKRIREDVAAGHTLHLSMSQTKLFPPMVVQMTAIGEESGALDSMLFKVAEFFEEQVSDAVDSLSTLLEPMIMVIIGTLVGGMVVALYLPIFKLAGTF